jgi:Holliday junction resolvasome RuvABC endonuclease subunit
MKASTEQRLEERIRVLHQELEAVIAKYVDSRAAVCPGVPRASVEATILARAEGCVCEEFKLVRQRITTAEELARKQAEHALPEG